VVEKRELILKIMGGIEGWADDNDIATSTMDQIELAERIYNMLIKQELLGSENGE